MQAKSQRRSLEGSGRPREGFSARSSRKQLKQADQSPDRKGLRPMLRTNPNVERSTLGLYALQTYEPLIGADAVNRILCKAAEIQTMRIAHISSTFYGGGVTEILTPLTLMMNAAGIETDWHLVQGTPAFFGPYKEASQYVAGRRDRAN